MIDFGVGLLGIALLVTTARGADPYADHLISYTHGSGVSASYQNGLVALGSPERFTGEGVFPAAVTPFNPPFGSDEIVGIGPGGSLVVSFDEPVTDDPANPFGLDLIVFGNTFFVDDDFPNGVPIGTFSNARNSHIEVSQDGMSWFSVPGIPDSLFPTVGYSDLTDPYATTAGHVNSDFTKPVNPAFNPFGLSFAALMAGYNGSGGGTGIDISSSGLSSISYVRITTSGDQVQIDGFSDVSPVPAPGVLCLSAFSACATLKRRRKNK